MEVVPGGQAWGSWLRLGHLKPAGQVVQSASPSSEYSPVEQMEASSSDDVVEPHAKPAAHSVQVACLPDE